MAAVIEDRNIGIARGARKANGGILHSRLVEIETQDGFETEMPKGRPDILGIVRRIGKMRRMRVGTVADHECDAPVRGRRLAHQAGQQQNDQSSRNPQSSLPR